MKLKLFKKQDVMFKKLFITVVGLAVVIGVIVGIKAIQINTMIAAGKQAGPPPESVATQVVTQRQWRDHTDVIGTITPVQGVMLAVESPGVVREIRFDSGQLVQAGDVLLALDSRSEAAELAAAKAIAELARINQERSAQLLARKTISQAEYDASDAEYKQAVAQVDKIQAVLAKKKIVAPFKGRLGIRQVNLGEYLNPGQPVVSLQSTDPIYVSFNLPQKALSFVREGFVVNVTSDVFPDRTLSGKITAIAAEVNTLTRMVEMQATLSNKEGLLAAGMYVQVSVQQPETRLAYGVPATAIVYASYGNSVFTVVPNEDGEGHVVKQNFVRLGQRQGDYVEVVEGLDADARVVVAGAFKLRSGMAVVLNDEAAPESKLDPEVPNT